MVGNEKIWVETDYNNIVVIDPNKTENEINGERVVTNRYLEPENLVCYANLECSNLLPRTRLAVNSTGYANETVSIGEINFLKPEKGNSFAEGYLDEITGLNSLEGMGANQNHTTIISDNNGVSVNQSITNKQNNNLLLITQITVETPLNLQPKVTIIMEDIRGRALFEQGQNSPYSAFFNLPYPLFQLTIKGYVGQAIKYDLFLETFNASFDSSTGNFRITTTFNAYKYGIMSKILMEQLKAVPYMYMKTYQVSPTSTQNAVSSQVTAGNGDTGNVLTLQTSKGLEKLSEIYSIYKGKNLIPNDFPVVTIKQLIERLESLETYILNSFNKEDLQPLTDSNNYREFLINYEKDIYFAKPDSWFNTNMDTDNFYVSGGTKIYTFKKEIREGGKSSKAITDLKGEIEKYNKTLSDIKTFNNSSAYGVNNQIRYETIAISSISESSIDWEETYKQRSGKRVKYDGTTITDTNFTDFKNNETTYLNAFSQSQGNITQSWFSFKSFTDQISIMQTQLTKKTEQIQQELSDKLSRRLDDKNNGLGFKPILKNIMAVVLANTEAFLRLMCDVHADAWNVRDDNDRQNAVLGTNGNKKNISVDGGHSITTQGSENTPIYPWPQYFVENTTQTESSWVLTYPGDSKVISETKGYNSEKWPEVQFVEEFLKGFSITQENIKNLVVPGINPTQNVERISPVAIDFPTTNGVYSDRQENSFFNEMWERVYLYSNYQRFKGSAAKNEIQDFLADTEFTNIQNSLGSDSPTLIKFLKQYAFNAANILPFLESISNNGTGNNWQKHINGYYVTDYIQNNVNNSFAIYDESVVKSDRNIISPSLVSIDKFENFITAPRKYETDILDTFPYSIDGWYKNNLANGDKSTFDNLYNTNNVYEVHDGKRLVANFNLGTSKLEKRPFTNFNVYNPTAPSSAPGSAGLKAFYIDRANDASKQQVTEGTVSYLNYSGNVNNMQTTSMLNTPFFVNSISESIEKWLTGDTTPFTTAAYLFLNSLPIGTLREKYKTYNSGAKATNDLDYIFATLKKYGAIHRLPYAWILKYGSVWYRYKKFIRENVDILDSVWTDFDAVGNYDPIGNSATKEYALGLNNIVLQSFTSNPLGSTSELNVGFYPGLINTYNLFYFGKPLFSTYTNAELQKNLSAFTYTLVADATINKASGYDKSMPTNSLLAKFWNTTLINTSTGTEYIVPSFGNTINQVKYECFDNNDALLLPVLSNPAVFNGSVRGFWDLPNYGYFDQTEVNKPSPYEYLKLILSGNQQQEAFSIRGASTFGEYSYGYTTIEEMFSVFNKDILDNFESEFLKFSKSMFDYTSNQFAPTTIPNVQISNLTTDTNAIFKNFQMLMKELMSVNITTPTASNSTVQTKNLRTLQFGKINNTLKNFLEYDVIMKYGNPGDFDRILFESYSTVTPIETIVDFGYYTNGSLPSSAFTGTSLVNYKIMNPETWRDLLLYVGFSTEKGIAYTNTGSTITDFFVDMNIQFTPESVQRLAPLIKIYATQKKVDPTLDKAKFTNKLNELIINNNTFNNEVLNSTFNKLRVKLPAEKILSTGNNDTILQGEVSKLDLWEKFKALNDCWISGYDYRETTIFEDVLILDRANRNISDEILIDPLKTKNILKGFYGNPGGSVFSLIYELFNKHNFNVMVHPGYVNFYNVQNVSNENTPDQINPAISDIGNRLFGTYLNVDTRNSSSKIVCVYNWIGSEHLEQTRNVGYKNDNFLLTNASKTPIVHNIVNQNDYALSNRVVGFHVDIGVGNQSIFTHFGVEQDTGKQTAESLLQNEYAVQQASGRQTATQNVSLWNFYLKRQYTCTVTSLGNAMIQPTMYFNLRYVPMFYGSYYITNVRHTISPGKFETMFKGSRQSVFSLPKIENYLQMITKKLFEDLYKEIKQNIDTTEKNATQTTTATTANTNTTNNTQINPGPNTGSLDRPDNSQNKKAKRYVNYPPANSNETTVSASDVAKGITDAVTPPAQLGLISTTNIKNMTNTKVMSFVTMYLESYNNNSFTTFNNNYAGVKLNYEWPGSLSNFFNEDYLSRKDSNGYTYPYATFADSKNMYDMLIAKWGPRSNTFVLKPNSLADIWIKQWAGLFAYGKAMDDTQFNTFVKTYNDVYQKIIFRTNEALELAKTLGLTDIYG